jgi:hypothetical protein
MSKYSMQVLRSGLRWLTVSNKDKVNIKVVVLDGIYNFAVQPFNLRSFIVLNIQYKIKNYVVRRITSITCLS